jgi:hypothetical protein
MDYQATMVALAEEKYVRRLAWEAPPIFLAMGEQIGQDYPDGVIYSVEVADSTFYFPWQPTEEDITANDWELTTRPEQ